MKGTIIILFIFVTSQFCLASKQNSLPVEPWRAIVFMEKAAPKLRWKGDISVKLLGGYTQTDSIMIENSIKMLNELCETVELGITTLDRGKLEIYFLDSTTRKAYESLINIEDKQESSWTYSYTRDNILSHFNLAVHLALVPENYRQHFLTNKLAHALFPKYLRIDYIYKSGREVLKEPNSIFKNWSLTDGSYFYTELSKFDRKLIQTVYASNYSELLPLAKKQFYLHPSWVNENSKKLIVFPWVFALFLFAGLIILFYKKLGVKIRNRLLQFNVISALALLSVGILTTVFFVIADKLHNPYFSFFQLIDIAAVILIVLILGLPALNVLRLIERVIHRRTQHKYFKVLLLFLSTSLIPSATLLSIAYFIIKEDINTPEVIQVIIIVFLVFIIIGTIRALISFYILKEKEIKIENEVRFANLRELKTKAELNALHSKINPHFLYNSLNSIAGLAKIDSEKTEHMALSLSKLFRYSINKEQSDWSTLIDEIEMVKVYLDIEKVRFDDRLEFTVELPEKLKTVRVPRFIIQPLVENAVKHGISKLMSKGEVTISIRQVEKWMEISVRDNGPDFPKELAPGFGLQGIYDKLEIMYPNRFELHFLNSPNKHILIKLL